MGRTAAAMVSLAYLEVGPSRGSTSGIPRPIESSSFATTKTKSVPFQVH